jgi:ubiquinone biosynthesis UbiH/UbiF/VisC/COQ6 family hydroxylase
MDSYDVVVIGAGIVGAAFALALGPTGLRVAVVEPAPPVRRDVASTWDSRIYTISPGNAGWLQALGAWQGLPADRLTRVETMLIFGDHESGRLEFSAYDAGLRELAWTAEAREVQATLWDALTGATGVTLLGNSRCREVVWQADRALLILEDGSEIAAKLIVGADGADSWVRRRAGIGETVHEYGQLGVVANFETTRPHEDTAFQWFREDGVLALLPLPNRRVSMVWATPDAHARTLLTLPPEALAEAVTQASGGALGGLRVLTPAAAFALRRQHVERLVESRVALIGDAAHNVHPLAGQGVNLGLRDARSLAAVLAARGPQRDCGDFSLLRRYERERREDILALELTTDGLEKLFSPRAVWLAGLRNFGLSLVNAQPPLKTALVRRAAL